jgi:serine/threonine-protein kinase
VLDERYRLIRPLARGGMGSVWCAEHLALSAEVAVKIIDPVVAHLDMGLPRFLREARALAALHSPYIVQVIDFGSQGDIVFLVMELLEGKTLGQRLKAEGALSPAETRRILGDVCKAMSHAHDRGIVHRDLKPDNIFLCDGSREHVTKVLDFGIAKPKGLEGATNADTGAGAFLGTPSYMSPEQCRGLAIDPRSDLWALGAIAYECLSGKRLFAGDAVGDLVFRICNGELPAPLDECLPPSFASWLARAMAREPAQRFQSASELFAALSAVLDGATQPGRGVDSAVTLSERAALGPELTPTGGSSSTLARGSVEKEVEDGTPRSKGRKHVVLALAAVGALAALVFIVLVQNTSSPPSPEGSGPAEHRASAEAMAQHPGHGAGLGSAGASTARDAGAPAAPSAAAAERAGPREEPVHGASHEPLTKPSKRGAARPRTPLEMEELRRKR